MKNLAGKIIKHPRHQRVSDLAVNMALGVLEKTQGVTIKIKTIEARVKFDSFLQKMRNKNVAL